VRRRLLNLLTTLSLLLCVAAGVLWVRSYWNYDAVTFRWNPDAGPGHTSSGLAVRGSSHPGRIWLYVLRVADADGAFWQNEVFVNGGDGSYTAGDGAAAIEIASLHYIERMGERPRWFTWQRSAHAPTFRARGTAARTVDLSIAVPHWAVLVLTAALPLARWRAIRSGVCQIWRGRSVTGRCVQCGYDLRATPERCPECGRQADGVG
jgi:hypothetical protein